MPAKISTLFVIEEPIDEVPERADWSALFQDIVAKLGNLNDPRYAYKGAVLPVKFESLKGAKLAHCALVNRRTPSARSKQLHSLPEDLRAARRRDRVFFWLEKDEVPV